MKFLSFKNGNYSSIGILDQKSSSKLLIDIHSLSEGKLPNNMLSYLENFEMNNSLLNELLNRNYLSSSIKINEIEIIAPIPNPSSFRDAYAFRKHVEVGRKNRGLEMIPEYDEFPVFYFSNHNAICGPGDVLVEDYHMSQLDFEFEIAAVIGKGGRDIKKEDADTYIAGFIIMNDWSSRKIQMKEMKLNLGPAKGKDFATSIGPYLVTQDELKDKRIKSSDGARYDLNMTGYINDKLVSSDNFKNMTWTFAQIIERVSSGVNVYPGDLIGSGTCGTGCLLELNSTNNTDIWLKTGDKVKLSVDILGTLSNEVTSN